MRDFDLDTIRNLVDLAADPGFPLTGDTWLDARYDEQIELVGHTQPYYRLFYNVAALLEPRLTVELGSWQATAAAHFAAGWSAGTVITIDHHSDPGDDLNRLEVLEAERQYRNLRYLNGWTWDVVGKVAANGPIDILFIDSWHRYDMAMRDWNAYSPLLANVALVVCDDISEQEGTIEDMTRFWAELLGEKFLDDRVHPRVPMGFLRFVR